MVSSCFRWFQVVSGLVSGGFRPFLVLVSISFSNGRNISANELNKDLQKTSEWAYKGKMSFYPDLNKQAQEVIFSRKLNISYISPKIFFNNTPVVYTNWQKPLGMFSDESLQNWKNSIQEFKNSIQVFKNSILLQVQVSSKEHQRSLSYNKLGLESLKFRCWFRKI